jgi:DNA-binding CsgD family transcriptional regulator
MASRAANATVILASEGTTTPDELMETLSGAISALDAALAAERHEAVPPAEEIIFDIHLVNARYLLVRLPKAEHFRPQLSPREQEVVRMVAQGHPNKVIADVLGISSWTVCTHLRRIFAKVGVGSRAAMVARLLDNGIGVRKDADGLHNCEANPALKATPVKHF